MKKVIIAIILLINTNLIYSQSVVINEYFNSVDNNEEWIELLVVQDVVSLVGYSLIDGLNENGEVSKWSGGVQFKDNILWKNLRQGSIIVVNFRDNPITDKNKNDGFIIVNADDETYFQKIIYNGNWNDDALNVDNNCDVFQLINFQGTPEHTIGHSRNKDDLKIDLQSLFLISSNNCMISSAIAVLPAKNLSDYSGGFDDNKIKLITDPNYISKGLPNRNLLNYNSNATFWKSLRQPNWSNPTMTANIKDNEVDLFWNSCDDNFPSDMTVGYLIVRFNIKDIDSVEHPKDGTTYKKGDFIGKAIVVDNDANSLTTSYSDDFSFDCNDVFRYRVYAYRFGADNLLGNNIDESYKRGRIYNVENFAEVLVSKKRPIIPKIIVEGDSTFCEGDSVKLSCEAPGGPFQYTWFVDSTPIPNANKREFYASKTGMYKVRITNEKGCYSESKEVQLIQLPTPHSEIRINNILITKDTLIEVCKGEKVELNLSGGDRYEWFKDDSLIVENVDKITINQDGIYYGVAINNGMECSDTTYKVFFNELDINFSINKDTLYYYLDKFISYEDKSLEIENIGMDTLEFIDIVLPPGGIFSVFAPVPSLVVNPKSVKEYRVRFEPDRSGMFLDSISFISPCLDSEKKVYINAYKEPLDLTVIPDILVFPDRINCDSSVDTLAFKIFNKEDSSISLNKPFLNNDFQFVTNNFPYKIKAKDSLELRVVFNSINPGIYNENVELQLISEQGIKEKLYIKLQGVVKKVDFTVLHNDSSFSEIHFQDLIGCEDTAYAEIKIINTGEILLTISDNSQLSEIIFPDLPLTFEPGGERTIEVIFVPENQGSFDQNVELVIQPCNYSKKIRFLGNKNGISYKIEKKSIDFGFVLNCKDSLPIVLDNSIIVSGVAQDSAYIENITEPNSMAFDINLNQGKKLSDTNDFEITFNSVPDGIYLDTIEIKFQPCDVTKIIYLKGERGKPEISFSSNTLNFGKIQRGKSDTLSLIVRNSGKIDFNLLPLKTLNYPFKILNDFSGTLKPNDSIDLQILFSPQEESVFNDTITFIIDEPCNIKKEVYLLGEGIKPKDVIGVLNFGENITCSPGDIINVPVEFNVTNDVELNEVNLKSFGFDLNYNYSLLFPIDIEIDGNLLSSKVTINNFKETNPGQLKVNIDFTEPQMLNDGKWFDIKFLVLLGNSMETEIIADNYVFNADVKFSITSDRTKVIIKDENNISNKLIEYNHFEVYVIQNQNYNGIIKLRINSEKNGDFLIDIYNLTGNIIFTESKSLSSGVNILSISPGDIKQGIYFIKISNSSVIKLCKLMVIK